jgi:hypothetical protein
MNEEINISQRIEQLINSIKTKLHPGLEDTIQYELARLINLLQDLENSKNSNPHLIAAFEVAISALLVEKEQTPNIQLAVEIREDLEDRIYRRHRKIFIRKLTKSPSAVLILGLCILLSILIPLLLLYLPTVITQPEIFGFERPMLFLVCLVGALGSVVSIMIRIQEFAPFKYVPPLILFLTGFFKPVVGASFALFVFAVLKAGLIPVTIETSKELYFFVAVSFISGFSERFAKDIATKTEQKIAPAG